MNNKRKREIKEREIREKERERVPYCVILHVNCTLLLHHLDNTCISTFIGKLKVRTCCLVQCKPYLKAKIGQFNLTYQEYFVGNSLFYCTYTTTQSTYRLILQSFIKKNHTTVHYYQSKK